MHQAIFVKVIQVVAAFGGKAASSVSMSLLSHHDVTFDQAFWSRLFIQGIGLIMIERLAPKSGTKSEHSEEKASPKAENLETSKAETDIVESASSGFLYGAGSEFVLHALITP